MPRLEARYTVVFQVADAVAVCPTPHEGWGEAKEYIQHVRREMKLPSPRFRRVNSRLALATGPEHGGWSIAVYLAFCPAAPEARPEATRRRKAQKKALAPPEGAPSPAQAEPRPEPTEAEVLEMLHGPAPRPTEPMPPVNQARKARAYAASRAF